MDSLVVATLPQWQRHERGGKEYEYEVYRPFEDDVHKAWSIPLDGLYFIIRVACGKVAPNMFNPKMDGIFPQVMKSIIGHDYLEMIKTVPRTIIREASLDSLVYPPHDVIIEPILARYRSLFDPDAYSDALMFMLMIVILGEYMDVEFATYASMGPISVDSIMKDLAYDDLSEMASRVITAELSNSIFVLHHAARGLSFMIKAHPQSDTSATSTRLNLIQLLQYAYTHSFPKTYEFPPDMAVVGLLWDRYAWFDEDAYMRTMSMMKRLNTLDDSVVLEIETYMTSPTMYKVLFLPFLDRLVDPWDIVYGFQPPLLRLVYLARTLVTSTAFIPSRYTKLRRAISDESDLSKLVNAMRAAQLIKSPVLTLRSSETRLVTLQKLPPEVIVERILVYYEYIPTSESKYGAYGHFVGDFTTSVWFIFRSIYLKTSISCYMKTDQLYSLRGKAEHMSLIFNERLRMLTHLVLTGDSFKYIDILKKYSDNLKKYTSIYAEQIDEGALKTLSIKNSVDAFIRPDESSAWIEFITRTKLKRLKLSGLGGMHLVYHIPKGSFPEFLHLSSPPTSLLPTTDKTEMHIRQRGAQVVRQKNQKIYLTLESAHSVRKSEVESLILPAETVVFRHRVFYRNLKKLTIKKVTAEVGGKFHAPKLTKLTCHPSAWNTSVFVVPKLRHLRLFLRPSLEATYEMFEGMTFPSTITELTLQGTGMEIAFSFDITWPELTTFRWSRPLPTGGDELRRVGVVNISQLHWNMPKLLKLALLAPLRTVPNVPYYSLELMRPTPLLKTIAIRGACGLVCEHPLPELLDIYCINANLTFASAFVSTRLRTVVQMYAVIAVPKISERKYAIALECTNDMTCSHTAYPAPPHAVKATPAMEVELNDLVRKM